MDNKNIKSLRRQIMAISAAKYNWNYDEFHELMEDWGYGNSLRVLSYDKLLELRQKLRGIQVYRNKEFDFDDQGNYMYSQLKIAGWNMRRLNLYLIKRFKKTHWNILDEYERRAVINMFRSYIKRSKNVT